jgi:hypothetical protein
LETKQFSGTDPPPLIYGRRMLIKNQVFRIYKKETNYFLILNLKSYEY